MSEATNISQLQRYGTATISDAMDALGIVGQVREISPLLTRFRAYGPLFTVRFQPVGPEGGKPADFVDDVPEGAVIAIDTGRSMTTSVWGGLLARAAQQRGAAGVVIDGVCRDSEEIRGLGLPVFSRGTFMRTGKDRLTVAEIGGRIQLGSVSADQGDIVCADADGVALIPAARGAEVAERCAAIAEAEEAIERSVMEGRSLREAREEFRYWDLQR